MAKAFSLTPGSPEHGDAAAEGDVPRAEDSRLLLRQLQRGQRELRADLDALVGHLDSWGGTGFAARLHSARFARMRRLTHWAPCGGGNLDAILADTRLARLTLAGAGQLAWAATRRMSRGAQRNAEAVQQLRLFVAGGDGVHSSLTSDAWLKACESLDIGAGAWEPVVDMGFKRAGHCGAVLGNCLYVCGGGGSLGRSAIRFSPARQKWLSVPPMREKRARAGAAVAGSRLYVCGGEAGDSVWRSMERFDPAGGGRGSRGTGTWEGVQDMQAHRQGLALVALGGELLACGGCPTVPGREQLEGKREAGSAEVFSPALGVWRPTLAMVQPRVYHAAVASRGRAFVAGGWIPGTSFVLDSVESYDPASQAWSACPSLSLARPRHGHAAVAFAGRLHVLGGWQERAPGASVERSVEPLGMEPGWREVLVPMRTGRSNFCAGVIATGPTEASCAVHRDAGGRTELGYRA